MLGFHIAFVFPSLSICYLCSHATHRCHGSMSTLPRHTLCPQKSLLSFSIFNSQTLCFFSIAYVDIKKTIWFNEVNIQALNWPCTQSTVSGIHAWTLAGESRAKLKKLDGNSTLYITWYPYTINHHLNCSCHGSSQKKMD